jgi:regulator of replication initiation timing
MTNKEPIVNNEQTIMASHVYQKFMEDMVNKSVETKVWKEAVNAYSGTLYKNSGKPSYKSDAVINYVFKTIETIRPIMIDNNPRFIALARTQAGVERADVVQKAMDYEWDREKMSLKLYSSLIPTLVIGNSIFYIPWDGDSGKDGNVRCIPVDANNIYVDPLATSFSDAEHVIYATYMHVNQLKKKFPSRSKELSGGDIKYSELVSEKSRDSSKITNQVLVLEMWMRDYATVEHEEVDKSGQPITVSTMKYPKGRVVVCAPELSIVLSDKKNPYQDGKFPFVHLKDYDIPFKFWGRGDVEQILSPQHYMNELNNQIIDNAKHTANMQWIIDKNAGIPQSSLTNRPGLIIRKNPGSEVRRDTPPPMPGYVNDKVQELKSDMETISGIHDANSGDRPTGIQAGNAIMALQEAGQTRIRLKVKLMEESLSELATMWYSRMQQFWVEDRFVRLTKDEGITEFDKITTDDLQLDYDIKISAGSTMPANKSSKLDLMIRLGQTMAEDGLPIVDRRAIMEFVDIKDKKGLLDRMDKLAGNGTVAQQVEQLTEKHESDVKEMSQIMQDLTKQVKDISGQLQSIESQWEQVVSENEKLKLERDSERKGYEAGLKEIPPDLAPDEKASMEMMREQNGQDEFETEVKQGKIPAQALNELQQLPDEELKALIEQYPQIEQMLANQ